MMNLFGRTSPTAAQPDPDQVLKSAFTGGGPINTAHSSMLPTATMAGGSDNGKKSFFKKPLGNKRYSPRMIIGALVLVLLVVGGGAGLYLVKLNQDLRQQASVDGGIGDAYGSNQPTPAPGGTGASGQTVAITNRSNQDTACGGNNQPTCKTNLVTGTVQSCDSGYVRDDVSGQTCVPYRPYDNAQGVPANVLDDCQKAAGSAVLASYCSDAIVQNPNVASADIGGCLANRAQSDCMDIVLPPLVTPGTGGGGGGLLGYTNTPVGFHFDEFDQIVDVYCNDTGIASRVNTACPFLKSNAADGIAALTPAGFDYLNKCLSTQGNSLATCINQVLTINGQNTVPDQNPTCGGSLQTPCLQKLLHNRGCDSGYTLVNSRCVANEAPNPAYQGLTDGEFRTLVEKCVTGIDVQLKRCLPVQGTTYGDLNLGAGSFCLNNVSCASNACDVRTGTCLRRGSNGVLETIEGDRNIILSSIEGNPNALYLPNGDGSGPVILTGDKDVTLIPQDKLNNTSGACATNNDCAVGYTCHDTTSGKRCGRDSYTCASAGGSGSVGGVGASGGASTCPVGWTCQQGVCAAPNVAASTCSVSCAEGTSCINGTCERTYGWCDEDPTGEHPERCVCENGYTEHYCTGSGGGACPNSSGNYAQYTHTVNTSSNVSMPSSRTQGSSVGYCGVVQVDCFKGVGQPLEFNSTVYSSGCGEVGVRPTPTPIPTPSPTPAPTQPPTGGTPGGGGGGGTTTTTTTNPTPAPTPNPTPSPTPIAYFCDSPCTTDAQCQTADSRFTCNADQGNRCRLPENPTSNTCQPPVGPQCLSISMTNITNPSAASTADPELGQAVTFTCGQVSGANHYIFRVVEPDNNIVTLQATGRTSAQYTISKSGKHSAQCQICTGADNSTCLPFEALP